MTTTQGTTVRFAQEASVFIKLHPSDNVVVSVSGSQAGEVWLSDAAQVSAVQDIPAGHKMSVQDIPQGSPVIKYGFPIGVATCRIPAGHHVHVQNLQTGLNRADSKWQLEAIDQHPNISSIDPLFSFQGWRRSDGRVAIRNEIWILNTVACVNQTANQLANWANQHLVPQHQHLDGVYAFSHPYGCSQLGDDLQNTRAILSALARHPHAAGVLLLGLGCENNQLADQLKDLGSQYHDKVRWFSTQSVPDEMESGRQHLTELARLFGDLEPETLPSSELVLGMKCGGSDGFSGITGNPLLGSLSDQHSASGGTVLLTEVPEMFGAEASLFQRSCNSQVLQEAQAMVDKFKDYFRAHGEPVSENPSPGNKEGGISTLEEKSLGCVQKGGTAPVRAVLPYSEQAPAKLGGLALVNGPGNDGVSITALTAAGANLIYFTTGRGTPMGAPVPTVKVATNSELAQRKSGWIDFNAGPIAEQGRPREELAKQLVAWTADLANHKTTAANERNGYREIAIWKTGVTL